MFWHRTMLSKYLFIIRHSDYLHLKSNEGSFTSFAIEHGHIDFK